jgi:hypothetical protein
MAASLGALYMQKRTRTDLMSMSAMGQQRTLTLESCPSASGQERTWAQQQQAGRLNCTPTSGAASVLLTVLGREGGAVEYGEPRAHEGLIRRGQTAHNAGRE